MDNNCHISDLVHLYSYEHKIDKYITQLHVQNVLNPEADISNVFDNI